MRKKFEEVILWKPEDYTDKAGFYSLSRVNIDRLTTYMERKKEYITNELGLTYKPEYIITSLCCIAMRMKTTNVIDTLNYRVLSEMMNGVITAKNLRNNKIISIMEEMSIIARDGEKRFMVNPRIAFACVAGEPKSGQFTRSWEYLDGLYQTLKELGELDYKYYKTNPEYADVANEPLLFGSYKE